MENISTGGYKILDLSAYGPFTAGDKMTVPGITEFVRTNISKPILVTGVVLGGVDVPAFFANLKFDETQNGYTGYYGNKIMTIYNNNQVIFAV